MLLRKSSTHCVSYSRQGAADYRLPRRRRRCRFFCFLVDCVTLAAAVSAHALNLV